MVLDVFICCEEDCSDLVSPSVEERFTIYDLQILIYQIQQSCLLWVMELAVKPTHWCGIKSSNRTLFIRCISYQEVTQCAWKMQGMLQSVVLFCLHTGLFFWSHANTSLTFSI